jgi:hypothetical protein
MNAGAGWYPDPNDAHVTRYWDGDRYTHERRWNGVAWVDPAAAPRPAPAAAPRPAPVAAAPAVASAPGAVRTSPPLIFWLFAAGSVGVAISAFLPWVSVSGLGGTISSEPGTGGPPVLVIFAAGTAALAWPTVRVGALAQWRRITLIPVIAFLLLAVGTNGSDLADLMDEFDGSSTFGLQVGPGAGFILFVLAVITLVVALVMVWRRPATRPAATSPVG